MRAARVMISFHLVFTAKFSVSQRLDAKDGDEVQFLFYRERGAPILEDGSNRRKLAGIWVVAQFAGSNFSRVSPNRRKMASIISSSISVSTPLSRMTGYEVKTYGN